MLYILDAQLKFLIRHGFFEWRCHRCRMKHETAAGAYYHLVDHHGLDPESAFTDDLENPHNAMSGDHVANRKRAKGK